MLKYLKLYFKFMSKYSSKLFIEVDVPIMEHSTLLQKFLISATISGNIRKVS